MRYQPTNDWHRSDSISLGEWFVILAIILLLLGLLLGCAATTAATPSNPKVADWAIPTQPSDVDGVLGPQLERGFLSALASGETFRGGARVIYAPTVCQTISGNVPGMRMPGREPRVGEVVAVDWSSDACVQPEPIPRSMSLLVCLRPPPSPVAGGSGCWLLVHPDHVIVSQAGSMLTQDGGWLRLRWIPTPDWAGRTVWVQALVAVPGDTPLGVQVTPALEINVGSAL